MGDSGATAERIAREVEALPSLPAEERSVALRWLGDNGDHGVLEVLEHAALFDKSWSVEGAFVDGWETVSEHACAAIRSLLARVSPTDEDRVRWTRILTGRIGDEWQERRIRDLFAVGLREHAGDLIRLAKRHGGPAGQRSGPILGTPSRARSRGRR